MSILDFTSNYGFNLIDFASITWHQDEYDNWRKLDSLLVGVATNTPFAVDTGAANAYVVAYTPAILAYASGLVIAFKPANANIAGAVTINVNGLGVKNIKVQNANPLAGAIVANGYVKLTYNGDHFEMIEPKVINFTIADGSILPTKLSVGAPVWDAAGNVTEVGTLTAGGVVKGADFKSGTNQIFFRQANNAYVSATITYSTADPSGGNDGDIWFKYT